MPVCRLRLPLLLLTMGALAGYCHGQGAAAGADRGDTVREAIRPLLSKYCLGCHGGAKPKGDLNLAAFHFGRCARWPGSELWC